MTIYRFASLEYDKSAWGDFFMGRRDIRDIRADGWRRRARDARAPLVGRNRGRSTTGDMANAYATHGACLRVCPKCRGCGTTTRPPTMAVTTTSKMATRGATTTASSNTLTVDRSLAKQADRSRRALVAERCSFTLRSCEEHFLTALGKVVV